MRDPSESTQEVLSTFFVAGFLNLKDSSIPVGRKVVFFLQCSSDFFRFFVSFRDMNPCHTADNPHVSEERLFFCPRFLRGASLQSGGGTPVLSMEIGV